MLLILMLTLSITLQTPSDKVPLTVKVPETNKERIIGLSQTENLSVSKGMLFTFEKEDFHSFTMKETSIPLALLFFSSKGELLEIIERKPFDPYVIFPSQPSQYILEANPDLLKDHIFPIMNTTLHF